MNRNEWIIGVALLAIIGMFAWVRRSALRQQCMKEALELKEKIVERLQTISFTISSPKVGESLRAEYDRIYVEAALLVVLDQRSRVDWQAVLVTLRDHRQRLVDLELEILREAGIVV